MCFLNKNLHLLVSELYMFSQNSFLRLYNRILSGEVLIKDVILKTIEMGANIYTERFIQYCTTLAAPTGLSPFINLRFGLHIPIYTCGPE